MRRGAAWAAAALTAAVLYGVLNLGVFLWFRYGNLEQPPRALGRAIPVGPLWERARAGQLEAGDEAPPLPGYAWRGATLVVFGSLDEPVLRREVPQLNRWSSSGANVVLVVPQARPDLLLKMPVVVDVDGRLARAYAAQPFRTYVVDAAGRIVYKSPADPFALHLFEAWRRVSTYAPEP